MDDKENKDQKVPAMEVVQKALKDKDALIVKQSQILKLPQVQQLLSKLEKGEEVTFAEAVKEEEQEQNTSMKDILGKNPGEAPKTAEDWDALSMQQVVEVIADTVDKHIADVRTQADTNYQEAFKELKNEITQTKQGILNMAVKNEIEEFKASCPDFEQYREKMAETVQKHPTLSVKEAYIYLKGQHAVAVPAETQTFSERPESSLSATSWEPPQYRSVENKNSESTSQTFNPASRSGSRNFKGKLQDALANVQLGVERKVGR